MGGGGARRGGAGNCDAPHVRAVLHGGACGRRQLRARVGAVYALHGTRVPRGKRSGVGDAIVLTEAPPVRYGGRHRKGIRPRLRHHLRLQALQTRVPRE